MVSIKDRLIAAIGHLRLLSCEGSWFSTICSNKKGVRPNPVEIFERLRRQFEPFVYTASFLITL